MIQTVKSCALKLFALSLLGSMIAAPLQGAESTSQKTSEISSSSSTIVTTPSPSSTLNSFLDIQTTESQLQASEAITTTQEFSKKLQECEQNGFLTQRPSSVQEACDKAFDENSATKPGEWLYNGNSNYSVLNLNDNCVLAHVVNFHKHEPNIYIIDVGGAGGDWGWNAFHLLKKITPKEQHVTIFSLTGGQECSEKVYHADNATLYQFNKFKIENIDEELEKRGFKLRQKVHLIISNWALRHLADPFGTLARLYSLLSPRFGAILSNGFLFASDTSSDVQGFPEGNCHLLSKSNTVPLCYSYDCGRDVDHFLLLRDNEHELELPLTYTGETRRISDGYQCASQTITVFKDASKPVKWSELHTFSRRYGSFARSTYYCPPLNQRSKQLYNYLCECRIFKR